MCTLCGCLEIKKTTVSKALSEYSHGNVIENDYEAIFSRFNHVQNYEESSLFIGL